MSELIARISSLEQAVKSSPVSDRRETWWRRSGVIALLGGLAALIAPLTTAVGGYVSAQQALLESQQQLVERHLERALSHSADAEDHVRHIRFLRGLTDEIDDGRLRRFFDPSIELKKSLHTWANDEYDQYFNHLEIRAKDLAERHDKLALRQANLERSVTASNTWYRKQQLKWTVDVAPDSPTVAAYRGRARVMLDRRSSELERLNEELEAARDEWDHLLIPYQLDKKKTPPISIIENVPEHLAARCEEGHARSCVDLGEIIRAEMMTQTGSSGDYDAEAPASYFKKACDLEYYYGCSLYIRKMDAGLASEEDQSYLRKKLVEGCEENKSSSCCNNLGWAYAKGYFGPPADKDAWEVAKELFLRSCSAGNMNGCDSFATALHRLDPDDPQAVTIWEYACDHNEIRACMNRALVAAGHEPSSFSTED